MSDYQLFYWSVPFRGQFVRAVLAWAGKSWDEAGDDAIGALMDGPIGEMPVPFMGPPMLIDTRSGFAVAEMPAIVLYLGETLDLLPHSAELRALTIKVVNDANDVIDEMTRQGGRDMWTAERWEEFVPRLKKWLAIWEETGRRHGLTADSGFLLGGREPGIADVITATLWTTMTDRFSKVARVVDDSAPLTAGLARRVSALAPLSALAERARAEYGDGYAGGQIGQSMTEILND